MSRRKPFEIGGLGDSDLAVPAPPAGIDFEESFLDRDLADRLERSADRSSSWGILTILCFTALLVLAGRLYHLSVSRFEELRAAAEGNHLRIEYLAAPRGTVFDRSREILAQNRPSFELEIIPLDLPEDEAERNRVVAQTAAIVGMDASEIARIVSDPLVQSFQSALIRQNIAREQALVFQERQRELPGFRVSPVPIRDYPRLPAAYAHLLGYVGKISPEQYEDLGKQGYLFNDSLGKTGLEQHYEDALRGSFGQRQVEVDARGIVKKIFGEKKSVPGDDLVLNIDAGLQDELYQSLQRQLAALNRRRAAAVAMDPRSGRILAYVSLPGFDNNAFAEGISPDAYARLSQDKDQPLFNRAIAGTYPPGSTVKPVMSVAALEEKIVTPETIIKDEGQIVIPNAYGGPDAVFIGYGRKALGLVNIRKAIALSSDIYFYVAGGGFGPYGIDGLGIERIAKYFRMFKLDQKLGIDLPGEKEGLVPDPDWKKNYFGDNSSGRWYLGDTYHVSIGQGDLLVSPLHVLSWTAAIANGGKIYRPFIVDRIEKNGEVLEKYEPWQTGAIAASPENIRVVQEGMREAVLSGTARSLQRLPISSAAKTGTAQFDARNRNRSHAWFTAYAPFEDPQIAITVLIEDGGEGGINSMPVVRDTLDWWARNRR